jgi:phenylalanyl-tRNA synthetase alpha chain
MQDTFYIDPKTVITPDGKSDKAREYDLVMRTQTSPMQVRAMKKYGAPLRCVVPGRVFRSEAIDANHETNFYQLEGLMIDEGISLANLVSVLKEMLSGVFKSDVKIRVRPGYFPFVEPGLEVDMACTICHGSGCPSCKHSGWLEMIGAGLVHPNVLRAGGIDPDRYSGFAFGMGIDRLVMMRYGINDIRLFHGGDLRFLEQF